MSELSVFAIIFVVYIFLVWVMYKEKLPSIWGMLSMGFITLIIVSVTRGGGDFWKDIYTLGREGAYRLAPTLVSFIFAGIFARSQLDTGIVENIVKRAAELGGDRPFIVAILLGLASAYVTVGAFAGGAFVSCVIAYPILVSMGLSPLTACVVEGFGVLQAIQWWTPHWVYFNSLIKVNMIQMTPFIITFQPFVTATWIAFVIYQFKKNRIRLRWSVPIEKLTKVERRVPLYALLCPLVPLVFILVFKMSDVLAFILGSVIGIIVTHPGSNRKPGEVPGLFMRIYVNGVSDMAYLIGIIIGIGFIMRACDFPYVKAVFAGAFGAILPSSAIAFILLFSILMVIGGLFRGPTQPWAMGGAVFSSIANIGKYPLLVTGALISVFNAFTIVADVTTGVTLYICALGKVSIIDFFKQVYGWAIIYGVIGLILITIYFRMW
jgi:hypothetical protein